MPATHEITNLLIAWSEGNLESLNQLAPLVEAELHCPAGGYLANERPGHILQATALVHKAYLRLIVWQNVRWQNRAHFFRVVAQMMRHLPVDYAVNRRLGAERDRRGARYVARSDQARYDAGQTLAPQ